MSSLARRVALGSPLGAPSLPVLSSLTAREPLARRFGLSIHPLNTINQVRERIYETRIVRYLGVVTVVYLIGIYTNLTIGISAQKKSRRGL